jgi:hypothetical protein
MGRKRRWKKGKRIEDVCPVQDVTRSHKTSVFLGTIDHPVDNVKTHKG